MTMNIEFARYISQNGRRGLSLLAPEGIRLPVEGALEHIGCTEGVDVYSVTPQPGCGQWVHITPASVDALEGAQEVATVDLQGGSFVCLLLLGPQAVIRTYGYKDRSSRVTLWLDGVAQNCPAPILLAMGLVESEEPPVPVPPPPPVSTAMADALRKAGLTK